MLDHDDTSSSDSSPAALRYPAFRRYATARFFTALAVQMQHVAIGWQVYALTGDPLDLGFIGLAQFLPFFVFVLPAGQVADRYSRKTILAVCFLLGSVCAAALLGWSLSGASSVWPVFAVLAVIGSTRAFAMPASSAITPNLVPRTAFPNAVALNSSLFHVLYVLGPNVVYATVAISLGLAAVLMTSVQLAPAKRATEPFDRRTVLEGLRFVRSRPVILGAISLDLFAVLFGGAVALLPAFARDVLGTGPIGLGILRTAPAVGAAATALWLIFHPIGRRVGHWMFGGVAVFGCAIIAFGVSTNFYFSLFALLAMGAGDMVSVYIRHLLVQLETPDEIRGRVSAVNAVFIGASNELGEFESGVTAAWWGIVPATIVGGSITLVVTFLWTRLFPSLWNMGGLPGVAEHPTEPGEKD